jgi:hypothetical protein
LVLFIGTAWRPVLGSGGSSHWQICSRSTFEELRMDNTSKPCPDCEGSAIGRRDFLRTVATGAATAAVGSLPLWATARTQAAPTPSSTAETAVKALFDTLSDEQTEGHLL